MNNSFKHAIISTLLCSVIILLNTDLSCLRTYLAKRHQPLQEHERTLNRIDIQRYAIAIPDAYLLLVKKDVYVGMSKYVRSALVDEAVVNDLHTSRDVDCRGSPLIRSP